MTSIFSSTHIIRYKILSEPIINFTIFAERHSGTNYLEYILKRNLVLDVTWNYGWKHWIGNSDWSCLINNHNTLFIGIVRNIYDWIAAMYSAPHHLKISGKKTYDKFLSMPFISYHDSNRKILEEKNYITQKLYSNIFECRYYKNNFLFYYMPILVDNFLLIRYEDLIARHDDIVTEIVEYFNIDRRRKYFVPIHEQNISKNKKPYKLSDSVIQTINNNTYWKAENIFNYYPREDDPSKVE